MRTEERFLKLMNDETELFPSICEMMFHSQVENGRQFLCAMNNITDYCTSHCTRDTDGINYHFVYLPCCPEWSRELLVRFLLHKMALTINDKLVAKAKQKTAGDFFLPMNGTRKVYIQLEEERRYNKKLYKLFDGRVPAESNSKRSLFVVQEKDVISRKKDKNHWLSQLYSDNNIFDTDNNVILTSTNSAYEIEEEIRKHKDNVPNIDNIYIFHSQNRGKITLSYNKDQLSRLNQYGVGIKNCVFFYLTERPFRLYHGLDNVKYTISSNLLNREIKRFDDYEGFITFTHEELDLLFNRANNNKIYIIDPPDREIFTTDVDSYFDELTHLYKIKNDLSLSFSEETQMQFMKENDEVGEGLSSVVMPFFNYYRQIWEDDICDIINTHIADSQSVAIILPRWVDEKYKSAIKSCFSKVGRLVLIKDFDDLKVGINVNMVILFAYRYTDSKYKSYPNSFDPLPLKQFQHGLTIINRLTHNNFYEWNKHFYDKNLNGFLYSDFRKDILGWSKRDFQRPALPEIYDTIDEAEADAREYMVEKCTIYFDESKYKCFSSAKALYKDGVHYYITTLKELPSDKGIEIQLLDDIVDQIKESLIRKTDNNLKSEEYIRKDPIYHLTEEQVNSQVELWKYLLKRKVDELGSLNVYNAILPATKEISLRGFERWTDFNYPMILPRSRKNQNSLLTFLGFSLGSPYHRVILTKKIMKNNSTRMLNSQIESLLQSILTRPAITDKEFDELFEEHSEILTLLDIGNASDSNTLVELLDISFKKVKNIIYDQD